MRRVVPEPDWPESWKVAYKYDLQEIYGGPTRPGYLYAYEARRGRAVEAVASVVRPPARVLDVAAAQGNFSLALAERGFDVTWNDLRDDLQGYVEAKRDGGTVHYAPGNVFDLDVGGFDAVLMTEVIEHVAHPDEFLQHAVSLVRPGGYIVMTTPNGRYFRNKLPRFSDFPDPSVFESVQYKPDSDGHIFLLHADEIRRLAETAGAHVERIEFFTNFLTIGRVRTAPLLERLPRKAVTSIESATRTLPSALSQRINLQTLAVLRRPAA